MAALAIPGMDLSLSEERMAGYRAFVNKIWNASRFVLMNLDETVPEIKEGELSLADRWIRSRLAEVTASLELALEQYKFYEAADTIYHFVWHEFCDWYIEMAKPGLQAGSGTTKAVLAGALDHILRLLHPFMPFVTEEIWSHLPVHGPSLALAAFPTVDGGLVDAHAGAEMGLLQQLVVEVRTIRAENRIPSPQKIEVWLKASGAAERDVIPEIRHYILALANASEVKVVDAFPDGRNSSRASPAPGKSPSPWKDWGAWRRRRLVSKKRSRRRTRKSQVRGPAPEKGLPRARAAGRRR